MNTVFQVNLKPQYKPSSINYQKAYVRNILRSLFLNKVRFFKKWIRYNKTQNFAKNLSLEQLNSITQLTRPGKLK